MPSVVPYHFTLYLPFIIACLPHLLSTAPRTHLVVSHLLVLTACRRRPRGVCGVRPGERSLGGAYSPDSCLWSNVALLRGV